MDRVSTPPVAAPERSRGRTLLRAAIAVALLGYLVVRAGPGEIARAIGGADLALIAAGAALTTIGLALAGFAQRIVLVAPVPAGAFWRGFTRATFVALWLPGRVGDFSLAWWLRDHLPLTDGALSVLTDKLLTLALLGCAAAFALPLLLPVPWAWSLSALAGAILVTASVIRVGPSAAALVSHRLPEAAATVLVRLTEAAGATTRPGAIAANLAIKTLRVLVVGASMAAYVTAAGVPVDVATATLALIVVQLLAVVPVSIQGIGVAEGGYVLLLAPQGVAEPAILAACLIGRLLSAGVVATAYFTIGGARAPGR